MTVSPATTDRMLSVLELTRMIKGTLEGEYSNLWVRGELSNLKRHQNGHIYFSLKEGTAAVLPCALFRREAQSLGFEPSEGAEVEAFGEISVWEPRGAYQFIVRQMRPAGLGALLIEFEKLKQRLAAEGLFEVSRKRPLPRFPRRVGLVTSPVGAAVRDMVKVLHDRWPALGIVLAPVRVQGEGAAEEIATAIERFNRYGQVDVLIVGRGGGSIEDLWAFNEERVVRAIAASEIPVVSAVGHETDITLADLVADVRAATPSNAAEIVAPRAADLLIQVAERDARVRRGMRAALDERARRVRELTEKHGFRRIHDLFGFWQKDLADLFERLASAWNARLHSTRHRLLRFSDSFVLRDWPRTLTHRHAEIVRLAAGLGRAHARGFEDRRRRNAALADRLRALSPRLVLERGYCLARAADGSVLRGVERLTAGDRLTLEFARGEADARVETVRPAGTP